MTPAILLDTSPRQLKTYVQHKDLYANAQNAIQDSQKVETTQTSLNKMWCHPYNGVLFNRKKK